MSWMQELDINWNNGRVVLQTSVHRYLRRDIASIILVDAGPDSTQVGRYMIVAPTITGVRTTNNLADALEWYAEALRSCDPVQ